MTRRDTLAILATIGGLPSEDARAALRGLSEPEIGAIGDEWWWQAHGGQHEPEGDWLIWSIVAGRGFGKTRAGAEWVWARARENGEARIALVSETLDEVARVMVEGESGLLECARCDEAPRWVRTRGVLEFPSGARAFAWSAERPRKLRGSQHDFAWCDELSKWPPAEATWNNLMLGLRLGDRPRTIVTTTPQPIPLLKRILKLKRSVATHGRTVENPHLPADYIEAMNAMFGGTRLGRQELDGVLFDDAEGALWTRDMLERGRTVPLPARAWGRPCPRHGLNSAGRCSPGAGLGVGASEARSGARPQSPSAASSRLGADPPPTSRLQGAEFSRIVIGLDPPASADGDACGIVACGLDREGIAWVLGDHSMAGLRPEGWARRVAAAAEGWDACLVVAEKNQGGEMIESVLKGVDATLPVRLVSATKSKAERAVPVALRFETRRARLAGHFPQLEDELCGFTHAGYHGAGSPDRADAMVWAITELIKPRAEPRVRSFPSGAITP